MKSAAVLVLSAVFWLLAWYWDTAWTMVALWQRSETFAHGFLIVPISVWLIWRQRDHLAALQLRPNPLVLPLLASAGFGWLLGRLAGAGVVEQYALVLMIPLLVWTLLGNQAVRALAFPLVFLLFAVPFGEFLEPLLMEHTANFTVYAIRLSGVPVYREGLFFTLPSGSWSVVEACSGLRYLIASLTLGVLYAYLTYRSFARRAIFIVFSVAVPIVANWLRAYMIVMIGHLSSMRLAVGVDHLIYGWLFFGFVMLILYWAGSFWREDLDPHKEALAAAPPAGRTLSSPAATMMATVAAAAVVAVWPAVAVHLARALPIPALQAPSPAGEWQPVAGRLTGWTPRFAQPRVQINQTYAKDAARVELYIGYYRNQRQGAQLISSENRLVSSGNSEWRSIGGSRHTTEAGNQQAPLIETKLQGRSGSLLVWHWYWVDGHATVNLYWAKLLQAKAMLLGRGDDGAVVIVYAPTTDQPKVAAQEMRDFLDAMQPSITRSLDDARRIPR